MSDRTPDASPSAGVPTAAERLAIALGTATPEESVEPEGPEAPEDD